MVILLPVREDLLNERFKQILSAREDDDHRRRRADQDQSEEHPGAGPLESARRQEQQGAEKDEIVDNTEDHLGDKAVRFTAAVTLLHYVCAASVFLIFLRLLRFFVVDFHCFRALITRFILLQDVCRHMRSSLPVLYSLPILGAVAYIRLQFLISNFQ